VKTSDRGLEFIRRWEGCKLKVYKDAAGYPTIGVGHLIVDSDPVTRWERKGITEEEAMELLRVDVEHAESCVRRYIDWPLRQNEFDALVSFTFNVGGGNLRRKVNDGDNTALKEFPRWNRAGGRVLKGLTKRRQAEAALFNLADYGDGP
jgi:GH24 family phage-related lysozyme (muramidase)